MFNRIRLTESARAAVTAGAADERAAGSMLDDLFHVADQAITRAPVSERTASVTFNGAAYVAHWVTAFQWWEVIPVPPLPCYCSDYWESRGTCEHVGAHA